MRARAFVVVALLAATAAAVSLASSIAAAGPTPQRVTLGSTSGTPPFANICGSEVDCTYAPFTSASTPELQVPFEGAVTSFSVNSGSAGGTVELRVLRPAGGGRYTGAGTSPPETLSAGVNTFTVSLAVKAGDILGLENNSSALMFDITSTTPVTAYYEAPPLADGSTAAPNHSQTGYRLLLSASVLESTSQTSTSTTTTATAGGVPTSAPPVVTDVAQSHSVWRAGNKLAQISARRQKKKPSVGTTFSFVLNEQAKVSFAFTHRATGREAGDKCVARTKSNSQRKVCRLTVTAGTLSFDARSGANKVAFQGRISRSQKLKPGRYTLAIVATNAAGQKSTRQTLNFTIVK